MTDAAFDFERKYYLHEAWEVDLLALCIWREGRNQTFLGMNAIAWSIRNRVKAVGKNWWGDDWEEVILKPWQYSSFNANDPNAVKLPGDPSKDTTWFMARVCAEKAYWGLGEDPTGGSTHYYNPAVVAKPKWAETGEFKCIVGDHHFYVAK